MTRRIPAMVAMLLLAACASGGASGSTAAPAATARGRSDLITADEIARGNFQTALDVVEILRPSMLRSRASSLSSASSPTSTGNNVATSVNVVVFLDEVRLGEPSSLRSIPAQTIREVRYISARDATTRWGTGYGSGAIQVISKK